MKRFGNPTFEFRNKQPGSKCINGRFKLGYEYIFEDKYSGTLRSKPTFLPVSDLVDQFIHSEQLYRCDLSEICDAIDHLNTILTRLEAEKVENGQAFGACNVDARSHSECGFEPQARTVEGLCIKFSNQLPNVRVTPPLLPQISARKRTPPQSSRRTWHILSLSFWSPTMTH